MSIDANTVCSSTTRQCTSTSLRAVLSFACDHSVDVLAAGIVLCGPFMRIAILCTGTRGDVQPFVALGAALVARGDDVVMTAPADLTSFVSAGLITAIAMPFSAQDTLNSELCKKFLAEGNILAFARALQQLDELHRDALVDVFVKAGEGAELIIAHPLMVGPALVLATKANAMLALGYLGPMAATSELPTPVFNVDNLGIFNRLSHVVMLQIAGRGASKTSRATAARLGVNAPEGNIYARADEASCLSLHMYSPALQPRPADWPEHHVVTGMFTIDAATRARLGERTPPAGLDAWLHDGDAPIFFGFGSMPVQDPQHMLELVNKVSAALDVRALVGAGWSGVHVTAPSSRVFIAAAFDHEKILPRCCAAVHHGGAGTTHASVRAGLPAVVCHFLVDQPYWARRLIAHGIGARMPFPKLTAAKLIDALRPLLEPAVKARAQQLSSALRTEDGAAASLRHIDEMLARSLARARPRLSNDPR
jgi:UDP:flavonoid glycosyltransferase YjiC (YdhE family)